MKFVFTFLKTLLCHFLKSELIYFRSVKLVKLWYQVCQDFENPTRTWLATHSLKFVCSHSRVEHATVAVAAVTLGWRHPGSVTGALFPLQLHTVAVTEKKLIILVYEKYFFI